MRPHAQAPVAAGPAPIFIIPHTHWDREWYLPFEEFRHRLIVAFDQVLDTLEEDPDWRFTMDGQAVALEDYLDVRPEAATRIRRLVRAGRLSIGPFYVLADEFLCSAEAHAQNLSVGFQACAAWGGATEVGYLPDLFGHIAQMPQLLRQAGVKDAVLWRGLEPAAQGALHRWVAPDGSRVLLQYLPEGYGPLNSVPDDPDALWEQLEWNLAKAGPWRGPGPDVVPNGGDHRSIEPHISSLVRRLRDRRPEAAGVKLGTWAEFFQDLRAGGEPDDLPEVAGELRAMRRAPILPGTLSARHWVKQAHCTAERALVDRAEPLVALATLADGAPPPASLELLGRAWRLQLQNLAHDSICGCSTDPVHDEGRVRSQKANDLAGSLARDAWERLAPKHEDGDCDATLLRWVPGQDLTAEAELEVAPGQPVPSYRLRDQALPTVVLERLGEAHVHELTLGTRREVEVVLREGQWGAWKVGGARLAEDGVLEVRLTNQGLPHQDPGPLLPWLKGLPETGSFPVRMLEPARVRVLVAVPAQDELGLVALRRDPSQPAEEASPWTRLDGDAPLEVGPRRLHLDTRDGSVTYEDDAAGVCLPGLARVRDVGDRGDEYTHQPVTAGPRPFAALQWAEVRRLGSLGAELRWTRRIGHPMGLEADRLSRSERRAESPLVTTARLLADRPGVEFGVAYENRARDHHLSLVFPAGQRFEESVAGQPFVEERRPVALPTASPGDRETPLPFHPFQGYFGVRDREGGLLVLADDLFEFGAWQGEGGTELALTLVRSVGWLSRDDLETRPGHAGPPVETPGAQELGRHRYRFAVRPVTAEDPEGWTLAQAFSRGARLEDGGGRRRLRAPAPLGFDGPGVVASSLRPDPAGKGVALRVFNPGAARRTLRLSLPAGLRAERVDLRGRARGAARAEAGAVTLRLAAGKVETLRLRPEPQ